MLTRSELTTLNCNAAPVAIRAAELAPVELTDEGLRAATASHKVRRCLSSWTEGHRTGARAGPPGRSRRTPLRSRVAPRSRYCVGLVPCVRSRLACDHLSECQPVVCQA